MSAVLLFQTHTAPSPKETPVMAAALRRPIRLNDSAKPWRAPEATSARLVSAFHRRMPGYSPTRLVSLKQVAEEIGVKAVYLKDEGQRLGLPSFKILGASWATFKATTRKFGLPLDSSLTAVKTASSAEPTTLLAATAGNHGRAVARMGPILGVHIQIFVPNWMDPLTVQTIKDEGALVTQVDGSYDLAVRIAFDAAEKSSGAILVQDTAFPGYEEIPSWIVEGYGTMVREIDEQLGDQKPDLVIVPVGVGSFAQSVVSHYKAPGRHPRVLAVEPDTAACLYKSLTKGEPVTIKTTPTIMGGLDCGTVSSSAWPVLQAGIDASLTISDYEAHEACGLLQSLGVSAGPCGAAPLAALRRLTSLDKAALELDRSSVVVLLCTEGHREYNVPGSMSSDDAQRVGLSTEEKNVK